MTFRAFERLLVCIRVNETAPRVQAGLAPSEPAEESLGDQPPVVRIELTLRRKDNSPDSEKGAQPSKDSHNGFSSPFFSLNARISRLLLFGPSGMKTSACGLSWPLRT